MNNDEGLSVLTWGALFAFCLLALFVGSIVWVFKDAQTRGKSGCLVAILVAFLCWPLGLVAWLVFRPDDEDKKEEEEQDVSISCSCGQRIRVAEREAGTKMACGSCGSEIVVPELSQLRRFAAER